MAEEKEVGKHPLEETQAIETDTALALPEGTLDPVYEAKAHVLNNAVQDIGMGLYDAEKRFEIRS